MKKANIVLVIGVLLLAVVAFCAGLLCSGRYQIQTVTYRTIGTTASPEDFKVCVKIDRLTGRAWVLEGTNISQHGDKWFREIGYKELSGD